jgi:lysophospholipase L1-like esterase
MLAVGGSTTECGGVDDAKVWTHLLAASLPQALDGRRAWVGNVGRDGTTTRDHVLHVKYLLQEYPRIDVVLALVGVNDMASALRQGWRYHSPPSVAEPGAERAQAHHAFAVVPAFLEAPWYKRTALWGVARRAKLKWQSDRAITLPNGRLAGLEPARLRRRTIGAAIESLPPLDQPLFEYRRNLNAMADLVAAQGARLVLVTQPSVWRDRMTDAEQRRLWFGWLGADWSSSQAYFTPSALARAMAAYNRALLDVCRRRGLDCIDPSDVLPRDSTVFLDDVHFTELGSRLLAQTLAAHLRARAPFTRDQALRHATGGSRTGVPSAL